jgi:hypothetical protein
MAHIHETTDTTQGIPETTSDARVGIEEKGLQIVGRLPERGVPDDVAAAYLAPQQAASDPSPPQQPPSEPGDS